MKAYFAQKIYSGASTYFNSYLIENEGKIIEITQQKPDVTIEDLGNHSICPLFVDLQIYGGGGSLFNTKPTAQTIKKTYEEIRPSGTGYFQITLSTVDITTMLRAIDACRDYWAQGGQGLIGLHLEGPYFNPSKRGAHVERYVRKPTMHELEEVLSYGKGVISYMTIAPEMFDEECLEYLLNSGIILSAGHSAASFAQAQAAFEQGINRVTHLYNAMSAFQHRAPGLAGASLLSNAMASVVCDGIHVDFAAIQLAKKMMGDRLFYITDAVTEDTDGEYAFTLKGDHYVNSEGTLAGSALSMWQAVTNGVKKCGFAMEESLKMATVYPARAAGLEKQIGYLEPGYPSAFMKFIET